MVQMAFLDRDGVRLFHEVSGDGPVVLLTHGYSASSAMFAANVGPLARDHTVVTWDLRGHGRTEAGDDQAAYTVPRSVDDMVALLDLAGAERAVVAGHSLGGYLSLELALAHPDRVAALVLVDTGPGYRKPEARERWNRMVVRHAESLGSPGLLLAGRGILTQHDARVIDGLPGISVPTLVVVGEHDEQFLGGSRYMASRIPGAELVVLAGADHSPNLSTPEAFDAAVRDFLDRVVAR